MIKVVKDLGEDWYVIELVGTPYHQIVNKRDMFDLLLEHNANIHIEEFPISEEELAERLDRIKQLREFSKHIKNN